MSLLLIFGPIRLLASFLRASADDSLSTKYGKGIGSRRHGSSGVIEPALLDAEIGGHIGGEDREHLQPIERCFPAQGQTHCIGQSRQNQGDDEAIQNVLPLGHSTVIKESSEHRDTA